MKAVSTASQQAGDRPEPRLHAHACHVYERDAAVLPVVASYLREGLRGGQRCLYITDRSERVDVRATILEGLDEEIYADADARLAVLTKNESLLRTGAFDPDEMTHFIAQVARAAPEHGGRVAADMSWALESGFHAARLPAYEQRLHQILQRHAVSALCLYDRRVGAQRILDQIRTMHPLVAAAGRFEPNPAHVEAARPAAGPQTDGSGRALRISDLQSNPA